MNMVSPLTRRQARTCLLVALAVDSLQIPLTIAYLPPLTYFAVAAEVVLDVIASVVCIRTLGFHWLLLPSLLVELVPVLDTLPTWTGCVALVIGQRLFPPDQTAMPPVSEKVVTADVPATPPPDAQEEVIELPLRVPVSPTMADKPPVQVIDATPEVDEGHGPSSEAPFESKPELVRSKEGMVIALLVIPSLLFAVWLLMGLKKPTEKPAFTQAEQMSRIMVESARRRVDVAREHCFDIQRKFDAVLRPGPEPSKWYVLDWLAWRAKSKAWAEARELYNASMAEAQRVQSDAETELRHLQAEMAQLAANSDTARQAKGFWAGYVAPVLHAMLAFSLFRFSTRAVFRFLLLKDRIGAIQI